MSIEIVKVTNQKLLKVFIHFPEMLYKDSPLWVPSLIADEYNNLEKKINPAFKHCEADYFLAYKNGKVAGRIAAIINNNANSDWNQRNVRFGWIDFIDDYEVSKALLDTVADWGVSRGMVTMNGPLGFSDMDKEGMLVEGFENIPSITTIYNYPYYPKHLEKYGLVKEIDWYQRKFKVPELVPEKLSKYDKIVQSRYKVRVFDSKRGRDFKAKGYEMFNVLNNSFSVLYEFTRLNERQIRLYINQYFPFINRKLVCFVVNEKEEVVAFAVTMPSLSKAVKSAKGKLFPFGFIKMLKALRKNDFIEMYMIGIVPEYQNKGLNAVIFNHLHSNFIKLGVKEVVTNPQLETNTSVISLFDYYDSTPYMTRRCYIGNISK